MEFLNRLLKKVTGQPRLISLVAIIALWSWIAITIIGLIREKDLSENELVNRETRVDQTTLNRFRTNLEGYQAPTSYGNPATTPFKSPDSVTN